MKQLSKIAPYLFSAIILAVSVHVASAQTPQSYQLLAPLPYVGPTVPTSGSGAFAGYVNAVYKIAILVSGVLAVVMITLGGIEYMGSESGFSKEQGKKKIENAIIGLLLLVSCFLILNTINPQLLNLNISVCPPSSTNCTSSQPPAPVDTSGNQANAAPNSTTGGITPLSDGTLDGPSNTNSDDPTKVINIYGNNGAQTGGSGDALEKGPGAFNSNPQNGTGNLPDSTQ